MQQPLSSGVISASAGTKSSRVLKSSETTFKLSCTLRQTKSRAVHSGRDALPRVRCRSANKSECRSRRSATRKSHALNAPGAYCGPDSFSETDEYVKNSGVPGVQELQNETVAFRRKRKLQLLPSFLVKRQKLELSLSVPDM